MKERKSTIIVLSIILLVLGSFGPVIAQMNMEESSQTCETCPMPVGAEALDHFYVVDENGTRHYVECIGCALKLLKTYDTIRIETYCDWYGPNYKITADISQHGTTTTVTPNTAVILLGGGCTANRMAYNETAAVALLTNGYSEYTMSMMQQTLPANTNMTTIAKKALTFAPASSSTPQSPYAPILLGAIAVAAILGSIIAYKKLKK